MPPANRAVRLCQRTLAKTIIVMAMKKVTAPFLVISNPGEVSPKDYKGGKAALYPTG